MTGTISQWKEFFKLRTDNAAHPDARALAIPLKEEFIKRRYIEDDITTEFYSELKSLYTPNIKSREWHINVDEGKK